MSAAPREKPQTLAELEAQAAEAAQRADAARERARAEQERRQEISERQLEAFDRQMVAGYDEAGLDQAVADAEQALREAIEADPVSRAALAVLEAFYRRTVAFSEAKAAAGRVGAEFDVYPPMLSGDTGRMVPESQAKALSAALSASNAAHAEKVAAAREAAGVVADGA